MDIDDGIEIIKKAYEKRNEDKAFQLYVARYPWMGEKDFVTFEQFYNPQVQVNIENRNATEILTEVKGILDSYQGGGQD